MIVHSKTIELTSGQMLTVTNKTELATALKQRTKAIGLLPVPRTPS
jgi:hypothetical protein